MTTQKNLSLQDLDIITTISESEKAKVCLVSVRENKKLAILKQYPGRERPDCYEQVCVPQSVYFPEVYGVWEENDEAFLLEEYIPGTTLQEKMDAEAPLQETEVIDWVQQICLALQALHNATPPIIHRDIKPENIMVTAEGKVKLIDFDAAREYKEHKERDTVMLGTKEYASPEQFGFMQTDIRSDIYSWGIVFAELIEHANVSKNYAARARKIIDRATMFDPEKRYANTAKLLQDLQHLSKKTVSPMVALSVVGIAGLAIAGILTAATKKGMADETDGQSITGETEYITVSLGEEEFQGEAEQVETVSLAEAYEYITIEEEVLEKADKLMRTRDDLYTAEAFCDNDSGMYSELQESVIGKDYVVMRFLKSNPRDIVLCDNRFEGLEIAEAYCYPYLEDLGIDGNRITFAQGDCTLNAGNVLAVSAEALQTLEPGAYTYYVDLRNDERSLLMPFYLIVHGEDEDVTNFRVRVLNEIAYYSSEQENNVVFYVNNTPYPIEEIRFGNTVLSADDYTLVDGGFGVVFSSEFLKQYELLQKADFIVTTQNGKQALCRVIYLHHF